MTQFSMPGMPLDALVAVDQKATKATTRVDSRLKLTFGQLVDESTHHVLQVD